jgi:hypothetical protein
LRADPRKIHTCPKWENLPFSARRLVSAGANKAAGGQLESRFHPRVLKDTRRLTAIACVAPTVRFNALAIFLTPRFSRAIDLNNRNSSLVHARRTTFLAISNPVFLRAGFYHGAFSSECGVVRRPLNSSRVLAYEDRPFLVGTTTSMLRSSSIRRAKSIAFAFNTSIA